MLLRLDAAEGARLAARGAPARAVASAVLIVVELGVISRRRLGAAVQEVGERAGHETRLSDRGGLFVLRLLCCSVQVP